MLNDANACMMQIHMYVFDENHFVMLENDH